MTNAYDSCTDADLIGLLQAGEVAAFDALYSRYAEYLYRYAFNILEDEEACSDAVQDVFVWLWAHRNEVQITNPKAYLSAAIKYRLTRSIQTSRRREAILNARPLGDDRYTDDAIEVRELQALIQALVASLPPRAKEIFKLSREECLSNKEIAQRLDIAEKTVENQLTIALRKLKEGLGRFHFWIFLL